MRKLVLSIVLLFGLFIGLSFTEYIVEAAEPTNTTKIDYTYQFNIDGVEGETTTIEDVNYGTIINVDSGSFPQSGKTYVGYLENNKVSPTLNASDTIRATDNTDITLIYKTSGTNAVIFMDANQDFIGVLFTDGSNHINSVDVPDHSTYTKPGLTVQGWTQNGSDVISDWATTSFASDTIVYIKYSDPATADLTLTVTNGSGGGSYKFNETVTVDTTGSSGTTFNYWLKDGEIASYNESYTFTMASNHTLEAVFDELGFTPHSGNFVAVSETFDLRTGYQTIIGQFDLADGEQLVEYGVLYSDSESTPTLATSDTIIKYSNKYNPNTGEFVLSFRNLYNPLGKYYRAFVTTIDSNDEVSTDYSNILTNPESYTQIWFYNPNNWSNLNGYVFYGDPEQRPLGNWPGSSAIQDGETDWWYIYVPLVPESQNFTMIFNYNDGSGNNQTPDISITSSSNVYLTDSGNAYSVKQDAENSAIKIYFQNYWWSVNPNIWAWDPSDLFDTYPGPEMIYEYTDSAEKDWYSYYVFTNASYGVEIVEDPGTNKANITGLDFNEKTVYIYWNESTNSWDSSYSNPI